MAFVTVGRFQVARANYNKSPAALILQNGTAPQYSNDIISNIKGKLDHVRKAILLFRGDQNAAAVQGLFRDRCCRERATLDY
jgi:hypothetical protein